MSYREFSDPNEILDLQVETPEMVENARSIEFGERQLRMLRRMGDIGFGLVERLEQIATSGGEAVSGEGTAPPSIGDLAGAYAKLTQALRRTLAMEARLAEEMKARRLGVFALRNSDDEETIKAAHECVDENIAGAMNKAIRRERPGADRKTVEHLLADMFERLNDTEEFDDYHQRPPGETVAKLCAAFGLDATFCIQADDETWMIRHGTGVEEEGDPLSPSPSGDAQDAKRPEWASVKPDGVVESAARPRPDGFAVCPSP